MYLAHTPRIIQSLMPSYIWRLPADEKVIYLTFDDGPIPEVTTWVLDTLARWKAKATFFCVGENVKKNPEIFERIKADGHAVGNHTYNHLNGWFSDSMTYFKNVHKCDRLVKSQLFRPPYGKIAPAQKRYLQRHYQIVMWDVLSGDFDQNITKEVCLSNVINHADSGSVVVFHDSLKAAEKMMFALEGTLAHFSALGYEFAAISAPQMQQSGKPKSFEMQL